MNTRDDLDRQAYQRLLAGHGGAPEAAFVNLAGRCVRRWLQQNERPPLAEALLAGYLVRMWRVVNETGLPKPLAKNEPGQAGEMAGEQVADLAERVYASLGLGVQQGDLDTMTRQLLKTCLLPEFRRCRESYREVVEGVCRRQELTRARERLSGSHCVDCPYWTALRPDRHAALLVKEWVAADHEPLIGHQEVFLPEDFRALRIFLWQHIHWAGLAEPSKARKSPL